MVSVNSWQSWGQPCRAVLAEALKGTGVVVWFGSVRELAPGRHGSAKALPRAAPLSALAAAPPSHTARNSPGPSIHLLLYVRLQTWVISPNAGSYWHIKMSLLMFWHMLDGLRLPLWPEKSVLHPFFYENLSRSHLGDRGDTWWSS